MKLIMGKHIATKIFLLFSAVCGAEESFTCLDTVTISTGTLIKDSIPKDHAAIFSSSPIRLSGINVFDGPPEQGAALIATSEKSTASKQAGSTLKDTAATWRFEGSYPQGKFISCDYAQGVIRVFTKLSDSVTSCTAKTEYKKPYDSLTASFFCQ